MEISPKQSKKLSSIPVDETVIIVQVLGHGSFRKRIIDLGFVRGKQVRVIKKTPLSGPSEYEVMGGHILLRESEAERIEVVPCPEDFVQEQSIISSVKGAHTNFLKKLPKGIQTIRVALVGNPNSGKTSLFNLLSGERERVGNYPGVTVQAKKATFDFQGYNFELYDLPGGYSISEENEGQMSVRDHLVQNPPDVVINVIDTTNLERHLFLTTELIEMNIRVVVALNMFDEFSGSGKKLDYQKLGCLLGMPMVPTIAKSQTKPAQLLETVINIFEEKEETCRHIHINYGSEIEESIVTLQSALRQNEELVNNYSSRFLSLRLLESDKSIQPQIEEAKNREQISALTAKEQNRLERLYEQSALELITDAKYGFIAGALEETLSHTEKKQETRYQLDRWATHRIWGLPLFLLLMWLMFQGTFTLGQYPSLWIEQGMEWISSFVYNLMPIGPLRELIVNGILNGISGVIVFLPNILLLFIFISLMEDSGYMARAAFIMDQFMHKIGLHGKSFIPLLMGFGCNVPAILATRSLESKRDRFLTMLIIPFMSCSARLPVFVLLISAFFPNKQGLVLASLYIIGVLIAVLSSLLLNRFFFKNQETPFVMELPPYRVPTWRSVWHHAWEKGVEYLKKIPSVILIASIILWALEYYPRTEEIKNTPDPTPELLAEQQSQSYIGQIGKVLEPVVQPLGFDGRIAVSLITGMAAKELVVSSLAVLSGAGDEDQSLTEKLREQTYISGPKKGERVFTPLTTYGFMVFILLYFPCIATIATIRKEAGWKWATFTLFYTTALAWLVSFAIHQIGSLF